MPGHFLSPEDRSHFLKLMRRQINSTVHRRVNVLLLLDDGWTVPTIARALYLDETTVREHRTLYETGGRKAVEFLFYAGRSPALDEVQQAALATWVDATVPRTCAEVTAFIRAEFGLSYTPHAMAKLLVRLGFVYRKPKPVPAKADARVQKLFLDTILKPLMDSSGPKTPLYFVDATHPSYTAHPAHGWMRRGIPMELKANHGRSRLNINGALSWPGRDLVHREEELITSAAMIRLFEDISVRHREATTITVVLDNARYNHSRELRAWFEQPDCRIQPLYLPSYAPNLNLIERFWLFMKREVLFNRAYTSFALFRQAFDDFFRCLPEQATKIARLVTDRFHLIGGAAPGIPTA